jgi:hypothetical protein
VIFNEDNHDFFFRAMKFVGIQLRFFTKVIECSLVFKSLPILMDFIMEWISWDFLVENINTTLLKQSHFKPLLETFFSIAVGTWKSCSSLTTCYIVHIHIIISLLHNFFSYKWMDYIYFSINYRTPPEQIFFQRMSFTKNTLLYNLPKTKEKTLCIIVQSSYIYHSKFFKITLFFFVQFNVIVFIFLIHWNHENP